MCHPPLGRIIVDVALELMGGKKRWMGETQTKGIANSSLRLTTDKAGSTKASHHSLVRPKYLYSFKIFFHGRKKCMHFIVEMAGA